MKILRLKVFQDTACYKKPLSFKVGETYPLPPPSTVKGMLHAVMGADEYIPMNLSIQGDYEASFVEYQSSYFFKTVKNKKQNTEIEFTKNPMYKYVLKNVNLLIHVLGEDGIIESLIDSLETRSFVSLGAAEYLVRFDEIEETSLWEPEEEVRAKYNFYIRKEQAEECNISYIPFHLCWKYEIKNGTREWEKIQMGYARKGQVLDEEDILVDDENNPAFFCLPLENAPVRR